MAKSAQDDAPHPDLVHLNDDGEQVLLNGQIPGQDMAIGMVNLNVDDEELMDGLPKAPMLIPESNVRGVLLDGVGDGIPGDCMNDVGLVQPPIAGENWHALQAGTGEGVVNMPQLLAILPAEIEEGGFKLDMGEGMAE
ncbi:hypothetical protein AMTR_s00041p00159560 [Amborella trichopoda]|uniref:Uncharacterized protein n=1 Tax=Amborella trichopoda TaxID=13333 RepID=W1PZ97_AMBTC|nr:hypothetical protein AMTR_s00041p00159560 [Amborella trichopoda]